MNYWKQPSLDLVPHLRVMLQFLLINSPERGTFKKIFGVNDGLDFIVGVNQPIPANVSTKRQGAHKGYLVIQLIV